METTEDPFLKAWEARERSPSPTVPSGPSTDPWGNVAAGAEGAIIQGNQTGTIHAEQERPLSAAEVPFDQVFQQCNNPKESAIPNKNNSHGTDVGNGGFDDDFGAWSETDVLFKSGLLDQEFKTVSVTAEEDDLWSSADLSSLNLSLQSQSLVSHDDCKRRPEDEVVSAEREAFQHTDVILSSEVAGNGDDDSGINDDGINRPLSSTPKSNQKKIRNQTVGIKPGLDQNLFGSAGDGDINREENRVNIDSGVAVRHVTHTNAVEATAGNSKTVDTGEFGVSHSSLLPGSTTRTVNASIDSAQNSEVSNSEAFSVNAQSRSLYSASGEESRTSGNPKAHSRDRIPSIVVDSTSGTFLEKTDPKTKMGNILDSDKEEEQEKMEGEGGATQETGEQNLPPETTEVNGDTIEPIIDRKEAVKLRDEGTEVMVNGDEDDNDSMNVSLDTQTQTREDEFPPDEYAAGPTTGEDQSIEGGLGAGKEHETSQELLQKEEEEEEEEEGEENKDDGNNDVEGAVVDDEKEDSSEGYGSQDADKALENEGDGTEEPGKEDGRVESEKEPEVALSQDEGLASPEVEDSQLVSTSNSDQTVEQEEGGLVVDHDGNVGLVNVDHALLEYHKPSSLLGHSDTSVVGPDHIVDDTEQTLDTLEPCTTKHKQVPTENVDEQRIISGTNIILSHHNINTNQTDAHNDSDKSIPNISRIDEEEEGPDVDTEGLTLPPPGQFSPPNSQGMIHGDQTTAGVLGINQQIETDTAGEGRQTNIDIKLEFNGSTCDNQKDTAFIEGAEVQGSNSEAATLDLDLQLPKEDIAIMEDITQSEDGKVATVTHPVAVEEAAPNGEQVMTSSQLSEQLLEAHANKEKESLEITEKEQKEGGEVEISHSMNAGNQLQVFQECDSKESELLNFDQKDLDQNNKLGEPGMTEPKGSSEGETDLGNPLVEETVVNFVDQVLSHAIEQVSAGKGHGDFEPEPEQNSQELLETDQTAVKKLSGEDQIVVESKVSEISEEAKFDEEKTVSADLDWSKNAEMDQNCNLELNITAKVGEKVTPDVVAVGVDDSNRSGGTTSPKEQIENEGKETRTQRWSVPSGQFTAGNFSYADPQRSDHSDKDRESESTDTGFKKFRPVKFRPSSQLSKDAKWRRTSIGVPRGWNAPPVDLILPVPESGPEVAPETTESSIKPDEAGPSSITSDLSLSSGSSVSLQSSISNDSPKVQEETDLYRAEPMVQAVVEEDNFSTPPPPVEGQTQIGFSSLEMNSDSTKVENAGPSVTTSASDLDPSSPLDVVRREGPISPAQGNSPSEFVRKTPPLSQKVEVYEIKEDSLLSPTGSERRQQGFHKRSATVGDSPQKLSKAEEERQQLLAALRVKRPVKNKWQGQVELEEKEKEKGVTLDEKPLQSLQKYEERRKRQGQSKSFDLGMTNSKLSEAKPLELNKEDENVGVEESDASGPSRRQRPHSLNIDDDDNPEGISRGDYNYREDALSPNGDTCSSGYTSGRSTPAGEDASRLLSLPKTGGVPADSAFYKEYQKLVALEGDQTSISNQESGLKPVVHRESEPAPEQEEQFDADGQRKSYVKSAVKMREKTGTRVNSHVVKQSRISFVEQEVLRHKQQEEEFRREREMRNQERMSQGKPPSPSSLSPPDSAGNSRLQSPTSPEPPTTTMTKPVKAPIKPTNSKAKAVYQELKYNPKTGGGNRSNAMVKQWESKFK